MSDEKQQQLTGVMNFIGQTASVLTIPVFLVGWYMIGLKIDNVNQAQQIINQQMYVPKVEFKDAVSDLQQADLHQWSAIHQLETSKADKQERQDIKATPSR